MLAEDHKGYGGSTTIVKLDTKGNQLGTYNIKNICPNGALGITAADGTNEKFIIMHYTSRTPVNSRDTVIFSSNNCQRQDYMQKRAKKQSYFFTIVFLTYFNYYQLYL